MPGIESLQDGFYWLRDANAAAQPDIVRLYSVAGQRRLGFGVWAGGGLLPVSDLLDGAYLTPVAPVGEVSAQYVTKADFAPGSDLAKQAQRLVTLGRYTRRTKAQERAYSKLLTLFNLHKVKVEYAFDSTNHRYACTVCSTEWQGPWLLPCPVCHPVGNNVLKAAYKSAETARQDPPCPTEDDLPGKPKPEPEAPVGYKPPRPIADLPPGPNPGTPMARLAAVEEVLRNLGYLA